MVKPNNHQLGQVVNLVIITWTQYYTEFFSVDLSYAHFKALWSANKIFSTRVLKTGVV